MTGGLACQVSLMAGYAQLLYTVSIGKVALDLAKITKKEHLLPRPPPPGTSLGKTETAMQSPCFKSGRTVMHLFPLAMSASSFTTTTTTTTTSYPNYVCSCYYTANPCPLCPKLEMPMDPVSKTSTGASGSGWLGRGTLGGGCGGNSRGGDMRGARRWRRWRWWCCRGGWWRGELWHGAAGVTAGKGS